MRSEKRAAAILVLGAMLVPVGLSAQARWRSVTLQAGLARGSDDFAGLGLSAAAEFGVLRQLRVAVQWTDWQRLAGCGVEDAPSECNAEADLWELGLRQALGVSPRVAPYVGVGFGLYRRHATSGSDATYSPYLSLGAGIDVRVRTPATVRLSFVHQELLDHRVEGRYRAGVRFTGVLFGIGLSLW